MLSKRDKQNEKEQKQKQKNAKPQTHNHQNNQTTNPKPTHQKKKNHKNTHSTSKTKNPHQPKNTLPGWQKTDSLPLSSQPSVVRNFGLQPQPLFVKLFLDSGIEKKPLKNRRLLH